MMKQPSSQSSSPNTGTTTALEAGTVEARGLGSLSPDTVSQEIQTFLNRPISLVEEVRSWFTVWAFLTRLPAPSFANHHPGYLMRGMVYFPMVGTWIGYFCGVWYQATLAFLQGSSVKGEMMIEENDHLMFACKIAAIVSLAASFWLTGCFHEDGLADSSDGIGGGWSRKQILTIMSDTRLGTYGSAVLILYVYAKLELVSHTGMTGMILSHTYSRWTSPYLIRTHDYVDDSDGPKTAYYSFLLHAKNLVTWPRVFWATAYTLAVGTICLDSFIKAIFLLSMMWVLSSFAGTYATYLLGGVMGDYLGATICVAEIVVYIAYLKMNTWGKWDVDILFSDWTEKDMNIATIQEAMRSMSDNQKVAGLNFFCLIIGTWLWKQCVGQQVDYYDVAKKESEGITLSVDKPHMAAPTKLDNNVQVLSPLENLLQSNPDATFTERYEATQAYVDSLAKPMGSLGTLEEWASRLGAIHGTMKIPNVKACCLIFAADHGVARSPDEGGEGCSAYPQVVTQSVVTALNQGVAGASVLAKANHADLRVIDVGVMGHREYSSIVVKGSFRLENGTKNSCLEPAMTHDEVQNLLQAGRDAVTTYLVKTNASLLCVGEVGIGNTTTSSILLAATTDLGVENLVDGGATLGKQVDPVLIQKKRSIVQKAMKRFNSGTVKKESKSQKFTETEVKMILAELGGAEMVAMAGALLEAADRNIPVLVDGFIATTSALMACLLNPNVTKCLLFATHSTERGHVAALERIAVIANENHLPPPSSPALSMKLRMGEGTGAIMAIPLVQSAIAMLSDMATLQQILEQGH